MFDVVDRDRGLRIGAMRKARPMTQAALAGATGLSVATIKRMESGEACGAESFQAVFAVLGRPDETPVAPSKPRAKQPGAVTQAYDALMNDPEYRTRCGFWVGGCFAIGTAMVPISDRAYGLPLSILMICMALAWAPFGHFIAGAEESDAREGLIWFRVLYGAMTVAFLGFIAWSLIGAFELPSEPRGLQDGGVEGLLVLAGSVLAWSPVRSHRAGPKAFGRTGCAMIIAMIPALAYACGQSHHFALMDAAYDRLGTSYTLALRTIHMRHMEDPEWDAVPDAFETRRRMFTILNLRLKDKAPGEYRKRYMNPTRCDDAYRYDQHFDQDMCDDVAGRSHVSIQERIDMLLFPFSDADVHKIDTPYFHDVIAGDRFADARRSASRAIAMEDAGFRFSATPD